MELQMKIKKVPESVIDAIKMAGVLLLVAITLIMAGGVAFGQYTRVEVQELRADLVAESDTVVGQVMVDKWVSMVRLSDSLMYISKRLYKYSKKSTDPVWVESKALNDYYLRKWRKETAIFPSRYFKTSPRYYF
jgi:hypothetical protein